LVAVGPLRRLLKITTTIADGTPMYQPDRKISAEVDESLEANNPHITIIAAARIPAIDATAEGQRRATPTIAIAGPRLNNAGSRPAVRGFASDHSSVVHVHMLPIDDPTTAEQQYNTTRRTYDLVTLPVSLMPHLGTKRHRTCTHQDPTHNNSEPPPVNRTVPALCTG